MNDLSEIDKDRIIEMAWEDRTPFEAILFQFNITETRGDYANEKRNDS